MAFIATYLKIHGDLILDEDEIVNCDELEGQLELVGDGSKVRLIFAEDEE